MLNLAASVPLMVKSSIIKSLVPSLDIVKVSVLGDPIKANSTKEPGEMAISGTVGIPELVTERVPLVAPPQWQLSADQVPEPVELSLNVMEKL